MAKLKKDTNIDPTKFKQRIKEVCSDLLPADSSSYTKDSSLPEFLRSQYLVNKSELLVDIQYILDSNKTISNDQYLFDDEVFELLRNVFKEMGRCKKVYYYDAGSILPGTQSSATVLSNSLDLPSSAGKWTYFSSSFSWNTSDTSKMNYRPNSINGNRSLSGFETIPNTNVGWNYNTRLSSNNTARVSTLKINNLIEALNTVEAQFDNFTSTWSNRSNVTTWWDGNADNSNNTSNKIFWVRYWCHTNCYSNCHTNRSRR